MKYSISYGIRTFNGQRSHEGGKDGIEEQDLFAAITEAFALARKEAMTELGGRRLLHHPVRGCVGGGGERGIGAKGMK